MEIHNLVILAYPSMFYHDAVEVSWMTGSLYRGKDWNPSGGPVDLGTVERVDQPSFCEMKSCSEFASWRVRYGTQSAEFCARHTLSSMRNRRLWYRK